MKNWRELDKLYRVTIEKYHGDPALCAFRQKAIHHLVFDYHLLEKEGDDVRCAV